jgi:hypothetical protein
VSCSTRLRRHLQLAGTLMASKSGLRVSCASFAPPQCRGFNGHYLKRNFTTLRHAALSRLAVASECSRGLEKGDGVQRAGLNLPRED